MLIKEYRIPLPLSVEEYRIAQLYMIQKKSRDESRGTDSGVEIIENKPYTNGPGGSGQYTYKIYHIGSHLPGWFRAILPKSALRVEEEAWNAYPYTKTRYRCPFVDKFLLEIETRYLSDCCEEENIFNMSKSEISQRQVDIMDIVKDPISSSDYLREEDPKLFRSAKTGRGPLDDGWRDELVRTRRGSKPVMTAYKLCRVEFKYWGMQNKIERFIHDIALRRTMLRAHRQAWCWQDEYHGLTMDDIRRLERETQLHLAEKMAASKAAEAAAAGEGAGGPAAAGSSDPSTPTGSGSQAALPATRSSSTSVHFVDGEGDRAAPQHRDYSRSVSLDSRSNSSSSSLVSGGKSVMARQARPRTSGGGKDVAAYYEHLEQLQESSDEDEFYDAHSVQIAQEDPDGDERGSEEGLHSGLVRTSSMEIISSGDEYCDAVMPSSPDLEDGETPFGRRVEMFRQMYSIDNCLPACSDSQPSSAEVCPVKILFMVLHGGNLLDSFQGSTSKRSDFLTLQSTFEMVIRSHYHVAASHLAFRLVHCPQVCSETLNILSSLSPFSFDTHAGLDGNIAATQDFVPLGAIALFVSSSAEYQEFINATIMRTNAVYHDFLSSVEGRGFGGQVCILADSAGSLLAYDAMSRMHSPYLQSSAHYGSHESIDEIAADESTMLKPTDLNSHDLSRSDPDLPVTSDPHVERRKRTERSRSEVSSPKSADLSRSDSSRPRSARLSASFSDQTGHSRRTSSGSNYDGGFAQFDFDVSELFMFGSPLGLVLAYRKVVHGNGPAAKPNCLQVYNLFHSSDPMAIRLEPLLNDNFRHLSPVKIARYSKFPLGDGEPVHVVEAVQSNLKIFSENWRGNSTQGPPMLKRQSSDSSMTSITSGLGESTVSAITNVTSRWWGTKRLDYVLYCPEALHSFPTSALTLLFHSSFWESTDVVAFILRQVVRQDVSGEEPGEKDAARSQSFKMTQPREKWLKRRTTIKVRNLQQNHRANDVIVLEDKPQMLVARFMYGSLDIVSLSGEKVDVYVMIQPPSGDWVHLGEAVTDSHGKLTFTLPDEKRLSHGMYPVKCVVKGDHTSADFFLTVLPPKTETVVFSIDGSFTASVSIMGKDPKVRAGAVDVVRHWQDLGYLILYVSARPDMQHRKVVAWLAQHNFPHGMVSFMDGLSKDPLRQKLNYLKQLQIEVELKFVAAYGSSKDINIYKELGLQPHKIFIVGKASKKLCAQAQIISDGYAAHLNNLTELGALRPATGNARLFLRKSCFRLPTAGDNKRAAKRTCSYPGSSAHKGPEGFRLPDTAPGPTQIVVPEIGSCVVVEEEGYGGGAVKARGNSPAVQKSVSNRTSTV